MIRLRLRPRAIRLLTALFFTIVSVALLNKSWNQSQDFRVFYTAAARLAAGDLDIYRFSDAPLPFKYAPAFAFAMVPFTVLPVRAAKTLWAVFNLAALLYVVFYLSRKLLPGRCSAAPAALAVLACLQPITDHFMDGQINLLILAAMVFGFDCLFSGRPSVRAAGAAVIASAAFIKLYPLLIALYFLRKKDWRSLLYGGLAVVVIIALPFLLVKYSAAADLYGMWHAILASSGSHLDLAGIKNQSLYGLLLRAYPVSVAGTYHGWLSAAVVIAAFFAVSKKRHAAFGDGFILDFSVISCAMLLVCPLTWIHYYVFYLPFCIFLFGKLLYAAEHRRFWWTGFAFLMIIAAPAQALTGTAVRNFFFRRSNCVVGTVLLAGYCAAAGKRRNGQDGSAAAPRREIC